jgi:hypothetical protein
VSLFDTLVDGLTRLIGLPPARDEQQEPPRRAIPLPSSAEPEPESAAEPEPEPEPHPDPYIDQLISATLRELPKAVAVGVIDLERGVLLGHETIRPMPESILELLGPTTQAMFGDDRLLAFERLLAPAAPSDLEQIILNSPTTQHVFTRLEHRPGKVMVVVCREQSNLGLVLAKLGRLARTPEHEETGDEHEARRPPESL